MGQIKASIEKTITFTMSEADYRVIEAGLKWAEHSTNEDMAEECGNVRYKLVAALEAAEQAPPF